MHFWVSAARVSLPGRAPGHLETSGARWPRKMGTNWFMPAFVNSRLGESGNKLAEGTMVWPFDPKKSKKDCRISVLVIRSALIVKTISVEPCKSHEQSSKGRAQGTQNCAEFQLVFSLVIHAVRHPRVVRKLL